MPIRNYRGGALYLDIGVEILGFCVKLCYSFRMARPLRIECPGAVYFPRKIICMVIATLVLVLPGCSVVKMLTTRLEKPTVTYKGFERVEASQHGPIVNFLFTAHNPNESGLRNITCSYELFVEGTKFLTGKDFLLTLGPKGDTEITVPATIAYADLYPVLGSVLRRVLSGRKTVPLTIVAVFSGKPALYGEAGKETPISFEWKLSRTVDFPLAHERQGGGE